MDYTNDHGQHSSTASQDFNNALAISEDPRAARMCDAAYMRYFSFDTPVRKIQRDVSRHTAAQAGGNDATICTLVGDLIAEEKYRPDRGHWDLAIEIYHEPDNGGERRKGWVDTYKGPDNGGPHVIAYAYGKTGDVLVMPWVSLRCAYFYNKKTWLEQAEADKNKEWKERKYSIAKHHDPVAGYTSVCLCVPIEEILRTVTCAKLIPVEEKR